MLYSIGQDNFCTFCLNWRGYTENYLNVRLKYSTEELPIITHFVWTKSSALNLRIKNCIFQSSVNKMLTLLDLFDQSNNIIYWKNAKFSGSIFWIFTTFTHHYHSDKIRSVPISHLFNLLFSFSHPISELWRKCQYSQSIK